MVFIISIYVNLYLYKNVNNITFFIIIIILLNPN